jgi:hypothetical protein
MKFFALSIIDITSVIQGKIGDIKHEVYIHASYNFFIVNNLFSIELA